MYRPVCTVDAGGGQFVQWMLEADRTTPVAGAGAGPFIVCLCGVSSASVYQQYMIDSRSRLDGGESILGCRCIKWFLEVTSGQEVRVDEM